MTWLNLYCYHLMFFVDFDYQCILIEPVGVTGKPPLAVYNHGKIMLIAISFISICTCWIFNMEYVSLQH